MGLFSSFLRSSFWGFMAIISLVFIIPQGGDGSGKPHYFLLHTNTNQAGMPNTQMNAMSHFPKCSGKRPGHYPETPRGLPSSLSPPPVPKMLAMLLPLTDFTALLLLPWSLRIAKWGILPSLLSKLALALIWQKLSLCASLFSLWSWPWS